MSEAELRELKREVELLRAEVADVSSAIKSESANTTTHLRNVYRYIADVHDYLMPILYKVFPNYAAAKKDIDTFMDKFGKRPSTE